MTTIIKTKSGSIYRFEDREDGRYLTANNVPNSRMDSIEGEHRVESAAPWPPQVGEHFCFHAPTIRWDGVYTSRIMEVEVVP